MPRYSIPLLVIFTLTSLTAYAVEPCDTPLECYQQTLSQYKQALAQLEQAYTEVKKLTAEAEKNVKSISDLNQQYQARFDDLKNQLAQQQQNLATEAAERARLISELNQQSQARFTGLESQLTQLQQQLTVQTNTITVNNGLVGIGTKNPTRARLEVEGNIRFGPDDAKVILFIKPGNNGTVSCNTFCAGSQWGKTGGCIGGFSVDDPHYQSLECNEVNPNEGPPWCVCVAPSP